MTLWRSQIGNVAPTLSNLVATTIDEDGTTTLTGTLSDPGTADTYTLDVVWGDPLSPNNVKQYTFAASPGGTQNFSLTHRYLDDNPSGNPTNDYAIALTATDDDGGSSPGTVTVTVDNVAPTLSGLAATMISENGTTTFTGTITDPGTLDTFTLDVNWGDPLSPDDVAQYTFAASAGGTQTFSLIHQYLDDNPSGTTFDIYTISATVSDDDQGSASAATTVTVDNVRPAVTIDFQLADSDGDPSNGDDQLLVLLSPIVSDPGTLDTFTYDWEVIQDQRG